MKKTGCAFLGLILGAAGIALGLLAAYYKAESAAPWIMGVGLVAAYFCFTFGKLDNENKGKKD